MTDNELKDKNGQVDVGKCEDDGHQNIEYDKGHDYDGDSLTINGQAGHHAHDRRKVEKTMG